MASHEIIGAQSVRLAYGSPAVVFRRIGVCASGVPALDAPERATGKTVASVNETPFAAFPGTVARVIKSDGNPHPLAFVGREGLQLPERPRMQTAPLRSVSRHPGANAFEIFKGQPAPAAFRNGNKLFGNDVVDVGREAPFLQPTFAQQTLGAPRPLGLQFPAP